jgi:hypothetical protein
MEIIQIENLPVSKASVEAIRQELLRRVMDGEVSAVQVQAAIKFYEKVFNGDDKKYNGLNDTLKPFVVQEIQDDPTRKNWYGFEASVGETGVKYNYANCNDPELLELMEKQAEINEKIKDRQTFLRSLKGGTPIIVDDCAVMVYPPAKSSTTSAKFLLK